MFAHDPSDRPQAHEVRDRARSIARKLDCATSGSRPSRAWGEPGFGNGRVVTADEYFQRVRHHNVRPAKFV